MFGKNEISMASESISKGKVWREMKCCSQYSTAIQAQIYSYVWPHQIYNNALPGASKGNAVHSAASILGVDYKIPTKFFPKIHISLFNIQIVATH